MQILIKIFPVIPELFILLMACLILMLGVFSKNGAPRASYYLSQITLIMAALVVGHIYYLGADQAVYAFHQLFVLDALAVVLKIFILIAMVFTFWYSHLYNQSQRVASNEFHVLGLLATLGMMILVSAYHFVTLFLGMELMSLPVYAMVAMMRERSRCVEAAMKYFIIGSVASGIFLYGLSLFFGATHSLNLLSVAQAISITPANQSLMLYFGLVFVIAGIAFKLGAAPFHSWVPDVYDGAPDSVTLFISAAPKIAAFGLAFRFLMDAAPGLHVQWEPVLMVIALLSIALGNVVALVQTNIKRLLAYSSIAHMGYIVLGLACSTKQGDAAALFYMVTYALTSLGAFGMITIMSRAGFEMTKISDFSGLGTRQPWFAFLLLLMLFSLAGIPPMVGFIAKLGILEALINVHSVWLAVVAIIFSIIGVYYYIRMIKIMYFEDVPPTPRMTCSRNVTFAMTVNGLLVLLLGIFPGQLFVLCHAVF